MKKNPIKKKKASKRRKAKSPDEIRALKHGLTKKQIAQLRDSPTLKRKLDRANKIFNSPEFKEFMEKNPIKKRAKKNKRP